MTTLSDDFNRADGGLGANWTTVTGLSAPAIISNQAGPGSIASCAARYTGTALGNDQSCSLQVNSSATSFGSMACVRWQSGAISCYAMQTSGALGASAAWKLKRITANAETVIASGTTGIFAGDVLTVSAIGDVISGYVNGVLIGQGRDSTYTSGTPGFYVFVSGATTNPRVDNWSATDDLITDSMTRADGAIGGNYSSQNSMSGSFNIATNKAVPSSYSVDCGALWTANSWNNDQTAEIEVGVLGSPGVVGAGVGVIVRGSTSSNNLYRACGSAAANSIKLFKIVSGVSTTLGTYTGSGLAAGDVFRLSAVGTTLTVYQNGVQRIQVTGESSIASGTPGIHYSSTDSSGTDSIAQFNALGQISAGNIVENPLVGALALTGFAPTDVMNSFVIPHTA